MKLSTASSDGPNTVASARATHQDILIDSARPMALQEVCIHDMTRHSKARPQPDARNPTQFLATFQKEEVMTGRVYLEDKVSEMNLEYKDEQVDEEHVYTTQPQ